MLIPAWFGGSRQTLVTQSSQAASESSFYLAYIVALHCATAAALLWFFRLDWIRIIRGFLRSGARIARERRFSAVDSNERLTWLIVLATIPVGVTGLALEHTFRTIFAKPVAASAFLLVNGLILLAGERARRHAEGAAGAERQIRRRHRRRQRLRPAHLWHLLPRRPLDWPPSEPCALPWHQPRRHHDGRRAVARARS